MSDESAAAKPIPQNIRNLHLKAIASLERNPDLAIDMFMRCVAACPHFIEARRALHQTAVTRYLARHNGRIAKSAFGGASAVFQKMKVSGLVKKGQNNEAMQLCEELLRNDPLSPAFIKLYAETAFAAGFEEEGLMAVDVAREHTPETDIDALLVFGRLYFGAKRYKKARECLDPVQMARRTDGEVAKMLKDAEALDTLDKGWEKNNGTGDYRNLINKEQAEKLERANKAVKTAADADSMIAETRAKIEKEPKNVNYYLALTGLYLQQNRYAEGLETIDAARSVIGVDPELDRRYAEVRTKMLESEVAALREAGDEEAAAAKDAERAQYVFDDIAERVQRYPNDQHLRFLLGRQYAMYGYHDEAIQQLQIAQKSPKDRVEALALLAECFQKKGMLDMAVEQLNASLELLPTMDARKMSVYYLLGEISEQEGKLDDSAKYFKEIYRADATYKDVAERVQRIYDKQKAAGNA